MPKQPPVDSRPWMVTNGEGDNRHCWFEEAAVSLAKALGGNYRVVPRFEDTPAAKKRRVVKRKRP